MGLKKFLHSVEKRLFRPIVKNAAPILGTGLGTFFGGPLGGILGGALGGSSQRGSGNKLKGALKGAAIGSLYSSLAPMGAELLGASPTSTGFWPTVTGLNSPSLLSQLGMASAPPIGGGLGLFGNVGTSGILEGGGLLGSAAGLAPKLAGFMSKKDKGAATGAKEEDYGPYFQGLNSERTHGSGYSQHGNGSLHNYQHLDSKVGYSMPSHDLMSGALLGKLSEGQKKKKSLHDEFMSQLIAPPNKQPLRSPRSLAPVEGRYARGGHAKGKYFNPNNVGYIKEGDTGGQDDDVDMVIPKGSYVLNATDLSLYGDGSSENGAKKIAKFEHSTLSKRRKNIHDKEFDFDRGGYTKPYDDHQYGLRVRVSNDEYVLNPKTVSIIGKGSNQRGAKILDRARMSLRQQKGVKKILPPKSKDFQHYLRSGGR